jgi:hypothetical protein
MLAALAEPASVTDPVVEMVVAAWKMNTPAASPNASRVSAEEEMVKIPLAE